MEAEQTSILGRQQSLQGPVLDPERESLLALGTVAFKLSFLKLCGFIGPSAQWWLAAVSSAGLFHVGF